jgi:hypothetical protein
VIALAPAHGMKLAAAGLCAVVLVPVLALSAAAGRVIGSGSASSGIPASWGGDVPAEMDELYTMAAARFGLPPGLLRAVGKVESDHGRDPRSWTPNEAGAVGPMQFLPATFAAWGWASGSAAPSITDPADAVPAAAAKLAADGAGGPDPTRALWDYNHSDAYVADVIAWALVYGWRTPDPAVLAFAVLHHTDRQPLTLRPAAAGDVRGGLVDPRLLAAVLMLATRHELSSVGPFVTGHSVLVDGTDRVSNHAVGRAVDLPVVGGRAVAEGNDEARRLVVDVLALPPDVRPNEVLSPWELNIGGARSATNAAHQDHVHLGFDG